MKKKISALIIAVCLVAAICAFAGCDDESNVHKVTIGDQPSYVFTASSSVMELTDTTTVQDYLNALKDKGKITFEGYEGDYGYYITSVNGTEERTISSTPTSYEGYAWNIYIDFIQLEGDDVYYGSDYSTCDYDGTTLYSASYGVSGLPCVEGHVYALVYVYSNMSW